MRKVIFINCFAKGLLVFKLECIPMCQIIKSVVIKIMTDAFSRAMIFNLYRSRSALSTNRGTLSIEMLVFKLLIIIIIIVINSMKELCAHTHTHRYIYIQTYK